MREGQRPWWKPLTFSRIHLRLAWSLLPEYSAAFPMPSTGSSAALSIPLLHACFWCCQYHPAHTICDSLHSACRYVVGVSDDAMYVSFMGTKAMRDIISDVNYVQTAIWPGLLGDVSVWSLSTELWTTLHPNAYYCHD